ncbi:MAG: flagellar motor protein MotB [Pseudomonadota bacterium]|nr:flagellar motor protein MotB [Pseudomonadota bacterium]
MARRKKAAAKEDAGRWMVSYADLLTLLFALFVVLYGFAMSAQSEVKSIVQGLVQSFTDMGFVTAHNGNVVMTSGYGVDGKEAPNNSTEAVMNLVNAPVQGAGGVIDTGGSASGSSSQQGETDESTADSQISAESVNGAPLDSVQQEISTSLQDLVDAKIIVIRRSEFWLTIDFNSSLMFPQGSATILNQFQPIINRLADVLGSIRNYVHLRGYTDDRYVGDELYRSSWELSSARAISMLHALEKRGISSDRMAIEAYGQFSPVVSNTTARGREHNRRVVVAVSKYAPGSHKLPVLKDEPGKEGGGAAGSSQGYDVKRGPDGGVKLEEDSE